MAEYSFAGSLPQYRAELDGIQEIVLLHPLSIYNGTWWQDSFAASLPLYITELGGRIVLIIIIYHDFLPTKKEG